MPWEIIVFAAALYQFGLVQIAVKKIGSVEGSRTRKLVWQFAFTALFSLLLIPFVGLPELGWAALAIALLGIFNAFGCYCHWRAYDISMSRTAMLTNLDDLIAMSLGYLVLNEIRELNPLLATGVLVSVISTLVFSRSRYIKNGQTSPSLLGWVIGYSLVWGIALFSMRYFSLKDVSMFAFAIFWYAGSWLGALIVRFFVMRSREAGNPLDFTQLKKVFFLAILVWTSLLFNYWLRMLVPITVIQPIQLVAEMSIPAALGLFWFHEIKSMNRKEKLSIGFGLAGLLLVVIAY